MKTYLAMAAGLPMLLIAGVAGTNYVLDPYLMHQWGTPEVQRLRQPVEKLNAWGKTYAIAVYRPDTIYLGNSRTELGLAVPVGGNARVFNAALSGSTLGDAIRMLDHARRAAPVRRVVWGLDAPSFTLSQGNGELETGLLARDDGYLARRRLLDLQRAVSIDMTRESLALLRGSQQPVCHASLARFGQRDGACMQHRIAGWGGTGAVINARTREFLRGEGPAASAFPALEAAIRSSCNLQWRLYVNPTHAMTIDVLYWAGKGDQYEGWLSDLSGLGERLRADGCDVRIFDFSGFNGVTSEAIPRSGSTYDMRNYWETSHYRDHIGEAILARLEGAPMAADGFGTELLPAAIGQRIADLRTSRAAYLEAYPYEAGRAVRIARDHAAGR